MFYHWVVKINTFYYYNYILVNLNIEIYYINIFYLLVIPIVTSYNTNYNW